MIKLSTFAQYLVFAFFATIISGCTANYSRFSAEAPEQIKTIKKIGIVSTEIEIIDVTAGRPNRLLIEQTEIAKKYFIENTIKTLEKKGFQVKILNSDESESTNFLNTLTKYREVNRTILQTEPAGNLQFEIGSLDSLSKLYDVDGFLFLSGYDLKSEDGTISFKPELTLTRITTFALLKGNAPNEKRSLLCLGIADKSGKLIYHFFNNEPDIWTFTREQSVKDLMIKATRDYTRKL